MRKQDFEFLKVLTSIIFIVFISISCKPKQLHQKGKVGGFFEPKPVISVASIWISNDQLVLSGSLLNQVESVTIKGPDQFDEEFDIESATEFMVVANGKKDITFTIGEEYFLIVTDPYAEVYMPISFVINDKSVTAVMLDRMGANLGDVLSWNYNTLSWGAISLNGLKCQGEWDARDEIPINYPLAGDYYYVSHSGNTYLDGISTWNEGDWAIYNGNNWERVETPPLIPLAYGRSGAIVAETDDYSFAQIDRSNAPIDSLADVRISSTPAAQDVLAWSETDQVWKPKGVAIFPGSVTTDMLVDDAIDGDVLQSNSILNADISASAAIDYSKLDIAVSDLNILQTDGLRTALDARLSLSGGTMGGNFDLTGNDLLNFGTVNGFSLADLEATIAANDFSGLVLDTLTVPEDTSNGGLYFTNARAQTASVENIITPGVLNIAPSQNAVFDALTLKEESIDADDDVLVNSLTTTGPDGVVLSCPAGCTETGELRLKELDVNGEDYIAFHAPDSVTNTVVWQLPGEDSTYGKLLCTNGSGVLYWEDIGAGGNIVTDMTTDSPINTTGGQTPILTMDQGGSGQIGYLSLTDWNTFNSKPDASANLDNIGTLPTTNDTFMVGDGSVWVNEDPSSVKISLSLGNVDDITLSTWSGSPGIGLSWLGTITTGTWEGEKIEAPYLPDGGDWNLSSDLNFDSDTLVITNSNKIGIGVAIPDATLDVSGTMQIDDTYYLLQADTNRENTNALRLQAIATDAASIFTLMPDGTSTISKMGFYNSSSTTDTGRLDYYVDNDTFKISSQVYGGGTTVSSIALTAGNIGIGTTSPNEILTIDGVTSFLELTSFPSFTANYGKLYAKSADSKLYFKNDSGVEFCISCPLNDNLGNHLALQNVDLAGYKLVRSAGGNGITVDALGNVGIGDVTPGAPLDIKDSLFLGNDSDAANNADILSNGEGLIAAETNLFLNFDSVGGGGDFWIGKGSATSGATKLVKIENGGNVGIGTTNPDEKLAVYGALSLKESVAPTSTDSYGKLYTLNDNLLYFASSDGAVYDLNIEEQDNLGDHIADEDIQLGTYTLVGNGGATGLKVDENGNVGIGLATPLAKLDLYGDLTIENGINTPKIFGFNGLQMASSGNGNGRVVDFNAVSTVANPNYVKLTNATPLAALTLPAEGPDANIDLAIDGKGTGAVILNGNVGIGVAANEKLTVNDVLSLRSTVPTPTSDFGKLYTDGDDLFYMDETGASTILTARLGGSAYDQKAGNVNGGSPTGTCMQRELTHFDGDSAQIGIISVTPTRFSLEPGKYFIEWTVPGKQVDEFFTYLYQHTAPAGVVKVGSSSNSPKAPEIGTNFSVGFAIVEISALSEFSIYQCMSETGVAGALGYPSGQTSLDGHTAYSVYTQFGIVDLK